MAFFSVGDNYRGTYQIEYVEPFFEGELAVASSEGERFFLQLTRLQKPAPPRAIQQYLSLKDHPLIVPYLQVYSEERSLVMIRPFVSFTERLHERIARGGLEEDQILDWVKRLFPVEETLKEKPLRMYTVLHPANIGLTESGGVQVLYCGVEGRTLPDPQVDWGNLLYMLFSGKMLDQPIKKLPPDHGFSKPLEKLIQRSFHRPANSVASNLESYLKKRDSKGFFDFLKPKSTSKGNKAPKIPPSVESPSDSAAPEKSPSEGPSSDVLRRRLEETRRAQEEAARQEQERREREEAERRAREEAARQEQERREREEAERRAREEAARQEQERREREEAERRAREEAARQEQERLERERREREEAERRAREEAARQEQERLERERREREEAERRAREEAARQEQERLERERREREEAERRAREEAARQEQERLERERREREEAERRAREEAARQEQERLERERREREEAERRAREEAARQEQERLERERREREEAERRAREEAARLKQEPVPGGPKEQSERARVERLHHDRLAAQFEEYVRHVFNRQSRGND
ncbi:hypothetical protein GCM10007416_25160 [Kroppenstedtia guangzhouensis]|uniref:Uncharacterized protein n=1 Tax=Kroppenstedtia guangzhouensis TaxID=1274356 RepID=A0ABQ1GV89_9BACL|nr:hypothetical protein [Kroppenstedtia guangzhouensis]GGA50956.1 hypothetical protein GCM10007416_25160 [Kroppenstedtia guangzhouensis]